MKKQGNKEEIFKVFQNNGCGKNSLRRQTDEFQLLEELAEDGKKLIRKLETTFNVSLEMLSDLVASKPAIHRVSKTSHFHVWFITLRNWNE
jgi:hypothetical protein